MIEAARVWHDVEFGSYAADLPLWEELARDAAGPVLELGCGTGRVALHLAERGHEVVGIDTDRELVGLVNDRAAATGVAASAIVADATDFKLRRRFSLVLAPMQLVQILGGRGGRRSMLARVAEHLEPGGVFAAAIVESHQLPEFGSRDPAFTPLPDVREQSGWLYSSLPLAVRRDDGGTTFVERLRQAVSPTGELSEAIDITELDPLSPEALADESRHVGFRPTGAREVVSTDWYVGSTACLFEVA